MDIRTLCLGILTFGDATGYEIKKRLEGPMRYYYDASFGSIYPALADLNQDGYVNRVEESQNKRPHKKIYSITQPGRLALIEALLEDPRPDRYRSDFMVTVLFADLMPAGHLNDLLKNRAELYRSFIEKIETKQGGRSPGQEFVSGLGVAVYKAALDYIEEQGPRLVAQSLKAQGDSLKEQGVAAE